MIRDTIVTAYQCLVGVHIGPVVGADQDAAGLREGAEILKEGVKNLKSS